MFVSVVAQMKFDTRKDSMSAAENELETFKSADNTTELQPNPDEAVRTAGSKRKTITRKTHLFVTICHWSMVILIALNLASGMRLGWGHIESRLGGGSNGTWSAILGAIAPKGALLGVNLITLHVTLAFFMFAVIGVYIVYLFWSRASHRMRLTSHDLRKLRTGMKAKNFWRNKAALWSANLLVYWVSFLFLSVLIVTGAMLYWLEWSPLDWAPFRLLGGYPSVRLLHGIVAYLFVPYIILHSVLQWFFGNFWSIFKAQLYRPHIRAGVIGLVIGLPLAGGLFAWNENLMTLTATRIQGDLQAPVLDGDSSDPVWSRAKAVTIRTVKGVNNPEGHVDVLVKAAHDGHQIYFLFQWKDPDVSYKRFPLRKTLDGWEVLNTAYERWDENVYYEDKLAMYITDVPKGSCAASCHVGVGPHSDNGDKHGVHFTNGEIGDVWHWKSVRTNHMGVHNGEPGYMDDQYFGPAEPPSASNGKKRYTAGYYPDPKTGGGYRYNFVKLNPDKSLAETFVQPVMLPPTLNIEINPDPSTSEHGVTWWIRTSEGIPYSEEMDTYSVGTLLPNILIEPFQGDRGDIRAKGAWRQGWWTLEARRVLDTGSEYDVAITLDKPVYISVAPFNRTQTRHGEHIRPVKLVLQK